MAQLSSKAIETESTAIETESTSKEVTSPGIVSLYDLLTGDEDARVCIEIPDEACQELPRNFFIHLVASAATKIGDELASAKLILAWLLNSVGAPAFLIGVLVPIRESGSLLPQLIVASYLRKAPVRKWFWIIGSIFEGLSVICMAVVAATLSGATAGWAIVGLLLIFSLSRGIRSVASKDVLGKTVSKSRRGTLMGLATAIAGVITVGFGAYVKFLRPQTGSIDFFVIVLIIASLLWFLATAFFLFLREPAGSTEGGGHAMKAALKNLRLLNSDRPFRHFLITRCLLLSTALSMPFYVALAQESTDSSIENLGLLVVAVGLSSSLSAPIWGRFADRSSRLVIVVAALVVAGLGFMVFFLIEFQWLTGSGYTFAFFFLVLGGAHSGVRLGRKTYLIDMATPEKRAAYVAISNSIIGVFILAGSAVGLLLLLIEIKWIILILAIIAGIAGITALKLKELR